MARANSLSRSVHPALHGKRRRGDGEEFWQFRQAVDGEPARHVDWRRSATSDITYVRDREHQASNTVLFWVDTAASMRFGRGSTGETKIDRSRLLATSAAMLLLQAEERIGILGSGVPARSGRARAEQFAASLFAGNSRDYGMPPDAVEELRGAQVVLLSDFLGSWNEIERSIRSIFRKGMSGAMMQLRDPAELSFPFEGRTILRSAGGSIEFETLRADRLRERYIQKLSNRRAALLDLSEQLGWNFAVHDTGQPATPALLWLCRAIGPWT